MILNSVQPFQSAFLPAINVRLIVVDTLLFAFAMIMPTISARLSAISAF
jgi:hypothetical protein